MKELKINVLTTNFTIMKKLAITKKELEKQQFVVPKTELAFFKEILPNFENLMPKEEFSGLNGFLIYTFKNTDNAYISTNIYFTSEDEVVYEVYEENKYRKVSGSTTYTGNNDTAYAKRSFADMLEFVSLKEIIAFIEYYLNKDYRKLKELKERTAFLTLN